MALLQNILLFRVKKIFLSCRLNHCAYKLGMIIRKEDLQQHQITPIIIFENSIGKIKQKEKTIPESQAALCLIYKQICTYNTLFHILKILKNSTNIHLLKIKNQWLPLLSVHTFEDQKDTDFLFGIVFPELENQTTTVPWQPVTEVQLQKGVLNSSMNWQLSCCDKSWAAMLYASALDDNVCCGRKSARKLWRKEHSNCLWRKLHNPLVLEISACELFLLTKIRSA